MSTATLLLSLGGGAGAALRYALAVAWRGPPPQATFAVNVLGAALLGVAVVLAGERPGALWQLCIGLCGGFTTFSSFALDTLMLQRSRSRRSAALNIGANVIACVIACGAGIELAVRWSA